ncbi:bifunctional 3'-5' exonuclease/DNA polymerase [Nocardioides alkalitolerans]|uniref:bifunctional 3'-5' exonuclease/DNA polymerase n=1 Tax=Nocardioides alkalitolerans TaxID=281714 RepID=UPI00040B264F|nr:bifunctional 3'-5' exonuclease/DNA polymerase [Nocardioides alkalitolerans]
MPAAPPDRARTGERISLSRLPDDRVLVVDGDGSREIAVAAVPRLVAEREATSPRWVWDDTSWWYPPLLAAGVRVRRCHDLRLARQLLRRAPAVDTAHLRGDDAALWDRPGPRTRSEPTLFAADDAEHLRADVEGARQLAAVAAVATPAEQARLELLLAAESAGALTAAEMTHVGVPWSVEVHERLLVDLLGPRTPRGTRPRGLEALAVLIRRELEAPDLNPDSLPHLLAALRAAGLDVTDTRAATLVGVEHPVVPPLLAYKQLTRLLTTNGWAWLDQWVSGGRFRASYQPAGSSTGRWSSNGGGALSIPVQVRPAAVADEGWAFVVADVAQLEPRVLAGMSADPALVRSARDPDLYQAMVDAGSVPSRDDAKLGLIGAMYGATRGGGGRMAEVLAQQYPAAFALLEGAARDGETGRSVRTLLGRGSPTLGEIWEQRPEGAPTDPVQQTRERRAYGRATRNFVVQGTGAEWALCWIAEIRNELWRRGTGPLEERPHLVLFLHDEVVVHTPAALADEVVALLREAATRTSRLVFREAVVDFPLSASVVRSYADASKRSATAAEEVDAEAPPATFPR